MAVTLVLGSLGARLVGWLGVDFVDNWPKAIAIGLAAMFVLTGVAHFVNPLRRDMVAIVPPRLRAAGVLVTLTGVLELIGAVGLLYPPTRVGRCGVPVRPDAGDVPRQRLRVAHADPTEVDDHTARRPHRGAGRLSRRCRRDWSWRHPIATRTGTRLPSTARSAR
jgi:hypothetical protein